MKFTYDWLKTYLKTEKSPKELADKLSLIGLEIEDLNDASENVKNFIVGEILEVSNHPNADKLHVLKVQAGKDTYNIVCGAPNVKVGLKSVLARVGDEIPAYKEKLKASKIRGVDSEGMLCSEKELLISDSHEGIIELPSSAKHGDSALKYLKSDAVFDGEITPNRVDYLSVIGIARDLSAADCGEFILLKTPELKKDFEFDTDIKLEAKEVCPYFVCVQIKDVKNKVSPEPYTSRLKAIGINPKSFLIDITNYETIDQCRPMHAFDADKLKGKISIRYAKEGEKFVGLDDKEYILSKTHCVLADENGVQLLSGIMGAKATGCDENTKNILLICETLVPSEIRRTARELKIESDAKFRFERGVDPLSALPGLKLAASLIKENCGGKISSVKELGTLPKDERKIDYNLSQFKKLIGIDIDKKLSVKILQNLGCEVKEKGDNLTITPPSFRQDLNYHYDITEELIRIYGYDKLTPAPLDRTNILRPTWTTEQIVEIKIKRALCSLGLYETLSWSFVHSEIQKLFTDEMVEIQNPIVDTFDTLQKTLLINLLKSVNYNQNKGNFNLPLFRTGPIFEGSNPGEQETVTCGILTGLNHEKSWQHNEKNYDVFDAKEKLFSVLNAFGLSQKVKIVQDSSCKYAHPKRFAKVMLGNIEIASFGQIHPFILKKFDIKGDVVFFQINQEKLPIKEKKQTALPELKLSQFQEVQRDFAFIAPFDFASIELISKVKSLDTLISGVSVFDNYDMKDGTKSLAINVKIQPFEKTLTDSDLETLSKKIIETADKQGLKLR